MLRHPGPFCFPDFFGILGNLWPGVVVNKRDRHTGDTMTSVRTLILTSFTAVVAVTVFAGGVASASTGGSGSKHGHCHHTKHGRGHAYGHRNHDHSCTPSSDPSPSTTIPADTTPSTTVPTSASEPAAGGATLPTSPISRPGSEIVIIEEPAPEASETPLPTETVAPRPDEMPTETPATAPVNTTAPVLPGESSSPESVNVKIPGITEVGAGSPKGDNNVTMPNAKSTDEGAEVVADGEAIKQNSMGIAGGISLWWLVVLLAVAAETTRRLRKARDRSVEPAEIA